MPPTLRELIESNARLADATLAQSHAINKMAESFDRLRPSFEQLRRDLFDLKNNHTIDEATRQSELRRIEEKLTLILDTVRTSESDIKQVAKDVTHPRIELPKQESTAERLVKTVEKLSTSTKIFLLVVLLIVAAAGWISHLFEHHTSPEQVIEHTITHPD